MTNEKARNDSSPEPSPRTKRGGEVTIPYSQGASSFHINNGRVAVEGERAGASDLNVHHLAAVTVGALEYGNLLAAGAAHHTSGVLFAGTFNQNLDALAD